MFDLLPHVLYFLILASIGWSAPTALSAALHAHSSFVPISEHGKVAVRNVDFCANDVSRFVTFVTCYESNRTLDFPHPVHGRKSTPQQHIFGQEGGHDPNCPACEAARREALMESDLAALPFEKAAPIWLERHKPYIAERTVHDYEQYISLLNKFFGPMQLREIHIGHLREFHKWRLQTAGASLTRMESSTLRQIMGEAGCWTEELKRLYKHPPLSQREKEGAGQSFTPEQEDSFVRMAMTIHRCDLVGHCANLMFKSGFGFGELRRSRRGDVDLNARTITIVEGAKNNERRRTVPLAESAYQSARWLVERWESLGGSADTEYLLPYRGPDFSRPMVSIQNGWNKVIAECVKRRLLPEGFKRRVYDCRVTAITKALASGKVSLHTAEKLFGHVSKQMQKRYYKPQIDVLRDAVEVLDQTRKPAAGLRLFHSVQKSPSV